METLEGGRVFFAGERIEIPASITAAPFYRKMGYEYKNGIVQVDEDGVYRLDKFG